MEVWQATQKDAAQLSMMCMEVQKLHVDFEPRQFKVPETPDFAVGFFEQRLDDPEVRIFIVGEAGEPMGYLMLFSKSREDNPFSYPHKYFYIDQIGVLAAHRGKGCGRALVEYIQALGVQEGISTITLNTWHFNTNAQAFFRSLGFETYTIQMWHHLPQGDE